MILIWTTLPSSLLLMCKRIICIFVYLVKYVYKISVWISLCKENMQLMEEEFWLVRCTSILKDPLLFLHKLSNSTLTLFCTSVKSVYDWVLLKIPLCPRRHWKPKCSKKSCLLQRVYILYWKTKVSFCFHWLLQRAGSIISNLPKLLKNGLFGKLYFFIWYCSILMLDDRFKGMNLRNQKGFASKIFALRKSWLCNVVQNTDVHHSPPAAVPTTLTCSVSYREKIVGFSLAQWDLCAWT